ncbi:MAG: hypothetical protein JJW00_00255 [Sulfurimonas sp.]|nr:hypothetical protein [Sulfurimonas sp.]
MAYIAGLVVAGLLFLALHYFTELTKKQKVLSSVFILVVILSAVAFNAYSSSQRDKMLNVVMRFEQNKTVRCKGIDVDKKNYTISIGTYTFIGKENTPNYGQMISASSCE